METVEHQFAVRAGPVFGYVARAGVLIVAMVNQLGCPQFLHMGANLKR